MNSFCIGWVALAFDPLTSLVLITHVVLAVAWTGTSIGLSFSLKIASATNIKNCSDFLRFGFKKLALVSVGLGLGTIILGVTLAELLLGFEAAFVFSDIRIWPLHVGGGFGLAAVLILIMGAMPIRNDILSLVFENSAPQAEARIRMLSRRMQLLALVGAAFTLISASLMALSRSVS